MIRILATFALFLVSATALLPSHNSRHNNNRDLPAECADFTAGLCNPNSDEQVDFFPNLPYSPGVHAVCQQLCQAMESCRYFTYNAAKEACFLFRYRYLDSCDVIGGLAAPKLDVCHEEILDSCTSFKREDCTYRGNVVFNRTSVVNAHACQSLLATLGSAYGAEYFVYDSLHHECALYDSKEADCVAFSGPDLPALEECNL
jgi:hypothetical protein